MNDNKHANVSTHVSILTGASRTCCAALLLLFSCSALAVGTLEKVSQTGILTLGYQIAPPFSYLDEEKPVGYSIDLCMKVVEAIKRDTRRPDLKVAFKKVTLTSRYQALINGEIDLECANSANTAEARKTVAFTIPTFYASTRLMVREGSGIKSIFDLTNRTVNTAWGARGEKIFDNANKTRNLRASNLITNDFEGSFDVMETDKVDAFILDDVLLFSMLAASKNKTAYVLTPGTLSVEALSLMLRKDDPNFKKVVDDELIRVIVQGDIYPIYRKWFESPIPPKLLNLNLSMSYMLRDSFKAPSDWVPN